MSSNGKHSLVAEFFDKFDDFYYGFSFNYEIFISGFSFDKLNTEIENKKAEFSKRLHDALSSVQGKILAIPVSLVLVANQIKPAENSDTIANFSVFLGAVIFLAFMCVLMKTQYLALASIREEMEKAENRFNEYSNSIKDNFKDTFDALRKTFVRNRNIILFVHVVALVGFSLTLWVYLSNTPVVWDWLSTQLVPIAKMVE